MQKAILASTFALWGLAAPVSAMPFPPLSEATSSVTPVAYGCGPGWTRGPYGGCHPIGGYYGYRPYYHRYYHPYYHPYYRRYYHPYYRPY
jgi:hypothetical protein